MIHVMQKMPFLTWMDENYVGSGWSSSSHVGPHAQVAVVVEEDIAEVEEAIEAVEEAVAMIEMVEGIIKNIKNN